MGQAARGRILIEILALKYPFGWTVAELFRLAKHADPSHFEDLRGDVEQVLGLVDGKKNTIPSIVRCWDIANNKVVFSKSASTVYTAFDYDRDYVLAINTWLESRELIDLIIYRPSVPGKTEVCEQGIRWEEIPHGDRCDYDYDREREGCRLGCELNNIQFSQRSVLPVVEIYELKKISLTFYAGESNRFAYLNAKSRNKSAGSFN